MTFALIFLVFGILCVVSLYVTLVLTEQSKLRDAVRSLARNGEYARRISFRSRVLDSIWRSVLLLAARERSLLNTKEVFDETISLSARLVGASDEEKRASEVLLEILCKQTAPDVIAAAVVLREPNSSELKVMHRVGALSRRTDSAILMCFDAVLDATSDQGDRWGYRSKDDGACFDFSVLGVGLCLLVPLSDETRVRGGIWLGLKQGATALSARKKNLVKALTEHAAASFYAGEKARERSEKSKRERDFLLGLSHDMRAPGNRALSILREVSSGHMGELERAQTEHLEQVEKAISEQMLLLTDVLDYAKHQKGFLRARVEKVSLQSYILEIFEDYLAQAKLKGLSFAWEEVPSGVLRCDLQHFRRVMGNLLSNAINYTDSGGISVSFAKQKDFLDIYIADTGPGISVEDRQHLFTEFYRAESRSDKVGVGLGLVISRTLAELNGGSLGYRPNEDRGSVFCLQLPYSEKGNLHTTGGVKPQSIAGPVLVIDDDAATCRSIVRMLSDFAPNCVPVSNVEDAKSLILAIKPQLVISDLYIEQKPALDLFALIPKNTPVVVLTGSSDARDILRDYRSNAIEIIEKPSSRDGLLAAIERSFSQLMGETSKVVNS